MAQSSERKLAAILAADVAGYSRLMEADEAATLAMLKACRQDIAGQISEHRGRIVGTAGDSVLAEFASAVAAVECAVHIQRLLAERNAGLPEERRMRFRIGLNVGDVLVEGDDLFGETVNIAARLQALAEPGGILISGSVFDQVRNKTPVAFDYLGPLSVKNISESVPAWRVLLDGAAPAGKPGRPAPVAAAPREERRGPPQRLYRRAAFSAVVIAALFAINMFAGGDALWFKWPALVILVVFALRTIRVGWR
jgi:adenylate cyclase